MNSLSKSKKDAESSEKPKTPKTGTIEGEHWVWPDGRKTPLKFIGIAIRKKKPLPLGFYDAAEKLNRGYTNIMATVAKHHKLPANVEMP